MTCGIYCIENKKDKKRYIGYSSNIESRWKHHLHFLSINKHDNSYIQNAWNKFGNKNFIFYVLEECDRESLIEREVFYIKELKTRRPDGYNLNNGGLGNTGWTPTLETLSKKSSSVTGKNNPMYGKKHTEKTRKLFSIQRVGTKNGVGNKNNLGLVKKYKNSTSLYYGVFKVFYTKKNGEKSIYWRARISINGKEFKLGSYKTEIEAARSFDKKCWETYKDLSKLNFPDDYK